MEPEPTDDKTDLNALALGSHFTSPTTPVSGRMDISKLMKMVHNLSNYSMKMDKVPLRERQSKYYQKTVELQQCVLEIMKLVRELDDAWALLDYSKSQQARSQKALKELDAVKEELSDANVVLKSQQVRSKKELATAMDQLAEAKSQSLRSKKDVAAMREDLADTKMELQMKTHELDLMKREMAGLQKELVSNRSKLVEAESDMAKMSTTALEAETEAREAVTKQIQLSHELRATQIELGTDAEELKLTHTTNRRMATEAASLRSEMQELEIMNQTLRAKVAALEDSTRSSLQVMEESLEVKEGQLQRSRSYVEQLTRENKTKDQVNNYLKDEAITLKEELAEKVKTEMEHRAILEEAMRVKTELATQQHSVRQTREDVLTMFSDVKDHLAQRKVVREANAFLDAYLSSPERERPRTEKPRPSYLERDDNEGDATMRCDVMQYNVSPALLPGVG